MSYLTDSMRVKGQLPPISLVIQPRGPQPGTPLPAPLASPITINRFLSYKFQSSVLVPVDTLEFTTALPGDTAPIKSYINEGDTVILFANHQQIATGVIDKIDIEFDMNSGEKVTFSGRNLFAQLEDQDSISLDSVPIYAGNYTPTQVLKQLCKDTIIPGFVFQQAPVKGYLFATEPGESKLQALTRYMEPLNCMAWMDPFGRIVFGRPNMAQTAAGSIVLLKGQRQANVTSIRASYNSTSIPNIIVPIWSAQENVQSRISPEQCLYNKAKGPSDLRLKGYRLPKAVVVSLPSGDSPQELAGVNTLTTNLQQSSSLAAGGSSLLQAYAKREIARANVRELHLQAVMAGHYNDSGNPYLIDSVYAVKFDRGSVNRNMYLYQVEYSMDPEQGQRTVLDFCNLGCIVSDVKAK
jgi:prophage tail gpP-like protein